MSTIQARARVQLTVEIDAGSPWGEDCAIGQVYKQAGDEAKNNLANSLKPGNAARITIIGEPKIVAIITDKQ